MKPRILFESKDKRHRILELVDECTSIEDLKGESYCPKVNSDIDAATLKKQETKFENEVAANGVFGYRLEVWNPSIDCGWTHVDSCYGFVGMYDPESEECNHHIVEELKGQIK